MSWARDRFRDAVQGFADDPYGYCGPDMTPLVAWKELDHVARNLGLDAFSVLKEVATDHELGRVAHLILADVAHLILVDVAHFILADVALLNRRG